MHVLQALNDILVLKMISYMCDQSSEKKSMGIIIPIMMVMTMTMTTTTTTKADNDNDGDSDNDK